MSHIKLFRGVSIDPGVHTYTVYIEEFELPFKNHEGRSLKFFQEDLLIKNLSVTNLLFNLNKFLNSIKKFIDYCDFICIESQLDTNILCKMIEYHTIAFFIDRYRGKK